MSVSATLIERIKSDHKIEEVNVFNACKMIGISAGNIGYRYIKSIILLISEDENLFYKDGGLSKIYQIIAESYGVTSVSIERAVRTAIERAFIYATYETINDVFGTAYNSDKGKPTNKEFIGNLYEYIKYN